MRKFNGLVISFLPSECMRYPFRHYEEEALHSLGAFCSDSQNHIKRFLTKVEM